LKKPEAVAKNRLDKLPENAEQVFIFLRGQRKKARYGIADVQIFKQR
jgi:hypothetical protein